MPEIETARLRLRMIAPDDLDDLAGLFGNPEVMKYLGAEPGTTPSREETRTLIGRMIKFWAENGFGRWAIVNKEDETMVGLCGFRLLDSTPELFYLLSKAHWGKGLATEAARACLRYGFEELGFERIVAAIRHGNIASIRVMPKIGMRYEKELLHAGINALCYVATRDEYQVDDSPYFCTHPEKI